MTARWDDYADRPGTGLLRLGSGYSGVVHATADGLVGLCTVDIRSYGGRGYGRDEVLDHVTCPGCRGLLGVGS